MDDTAENRIYRVADVAKRLDRTENTILLWEAAGKIPLARRDSRGWRFYTDIDVARIAEAVGLHEAVA